MVSMVVPVVLLCVVVGIIYLIVVVTHQVPSNKTKKENIFNTLQKAQKKDSGKSKKQNKKKNEKKAKQEKKVKQEVKKVQAKQQQQEKKAQQEKKKEKKVQAKQQQEKKDEQKPSKKKKKVKPRNAAPKPAAQLYADIAAKPAAEQPKPKPSKKKVKKAPAIRPHGEETAKKYNPDDFSGFTQVKKKKYQHKPRSEPKRDSNSTSSNSKRNGGGNREKSYRPRSTNGNSNDTAPKKDNSSLFVKNAYSTEDDFWSGNVTQPSDLLEETPSQSPTLQGKTKPKVVIKMFQPVATSVPNPWKVSSEPQAEEEEQEQESDEALADFPSL